MYLNISDYFKINLIIIMPANYLNCTIIVNWTIQANLYLGF